MRTLLDYRPALRARTGVGEYVHELARALAASGPVDESVTLFSSSWRDRLDAGPTPSQPVVDRRVPVSVLNYGWHRLQWPPVEWLAGRSFDVVHAAHPIRLPSRLAAQVVTVHDLDFLEHPERTSAEIRRDYPALAPEHIRAADAVITVSRHTAAEVERLTGRPASRVTVAPLGRPDWPARAQEPADGILLFLGTLEPRKNVGTLVEAYAAIRQARRLRGQATPRLVLAGGHGAAADQIRARITQSDLAGAVDLPGYITPEARAGLYGQAVALVMPSHAEGFGLPALEAMTVGVPVVAAAAGALPEVVGPAGRLYDPRVPEALQAALDEVLDSASQRARMRELGLTQAREFSWARTAARTREAWHAAIDARKARA